MPTKDEISRDLKKTVMARVRKRNWITKGDEDALESICKKLNSHDLERLVILFEKYGSATKQDFEDYYKIKE